MCQKLNAQIIQELERIVGRQDVVLDPDKLVDYGHDELSLHDFSALPEAVVKPETTEEVSAILNLAGRYQVPVTPRGGATGLCGGCVPSSGGIVLSLEKMSRILEIDSRNQMAVVEAGVRLGDFARVVEEAGYYFPPHPGDESAMIGGLAATNAGGSRAVKYGVIRSYIRGLEVVLPTGEVVELGGKLMKTSTGYNLMHLFIGSEGTLGVITKVILQVMSKPSFQRTLVIPFDDLGAAIDCVPSFLQRGIIPVAVEFVGRDVIEITEKFLQKRWPTHEGTTHLFLVLDASSEDELDRASGLIAEVCLSWGAVDIFIAETPKKQEEILAIRSKIYEAIKAGTIEILDICVPRAEIAGHVRRVDEVSQTYDIWLPTFGHAADGNIHTHIMKARYEGGEMVPLPEDEWRRKIDPVRAELYRDAKDRGGVISGEHGIGLVKRPYLEQSLGSIQVDLMRAVKRAFDPRKIMNPGKIFELHSSPDRAKNVVKRTKDRDSL
jgi:glycolate oxidase